LRDRITRPEFPDPSDDDAGAIAFTVYYVHAMDWSFAAGEPELLDPLCLAGNEQCDHIKETAKLIQETSATVYGA